MPEYEGLETAVECRQIIDCLLVSVDARIRGPKNLVGDIGIPHNWQAPAPPSNFDKPVPWWYLAVAPESWAVAPSLG